MYLYPRQEVVGNLPVRSDAMIPVKESKARQKE